MGKPKKIKFDGLVRRVLSEDICQKCPNIFKFSHKRWKRNLVTCGIHQMTGDSMGLLIFRIGRDKEIPSLCPFEMEHLITENVL